MKKFLMAGVALAAMTLMTASANAAYVLAMKGPGAGNPSGRRWNRAPRTWAPSWASK